MPIVETLDWNSVQSRSVDPYSHYTSESVNSLTSILGDANVRVNGLDGEILYDDPTDKIFVHVSPGTATKDYVVINIENDVYVDAGSWPVSTGTYHIVIDYKYEKKYPPNIARISFVEDSALDPAQHFSLYQVVISGSTFETDVVVTELEAERSIGLDSSVTSLQTYMDNKFNQMMLLSMYL